MNPPSDEKPEDPEDLDDPDVKEYGVVLKKKKFRSRIFPQRGKPPEEDTDSYKIV